MEKPKWRGCLLPIAVVMMVGNCPLMSTHLAAYSFSLPIFIPDDLTEDYYNRGVAKFELGDKKGASLDFDRAIRIDPQDAEAYSNRGAVKLALGNKQGAIADLTKGAQLFHQQGKMADYKKIIELIRRAI
jgi:tetratricopeptide (TPR) repeat protein